MATCNCGCLIKSISVAAKKEEVTDEQNRCGQHYCLMVTFDGYLGFLSHSHGSDFSLILVLRGHCSLLSVTADYLTMFSLCPP